VTTSESRTALVVAGMHRSGTSALAGTLALLGCGLPKTLFGDQWNAKGHFESARLIELHNQLLHSAGLEVEDWAAMPGDWPSSALAKEFCHKMSVALTEEFSDSQIVLKDPRICRFVELTANGLRGAFWKPTFLHIFRSPGEVAYSMARRNILPIEHNLLIWLRSILDAERGSRRYPRTFLSFEMLLADWRKCVRSIEADLSVTFSRRSTSSDAGVDEFLDQSLRHFSSQVGCVGYTFRDWLDPVLEAHQQLVRAPYCQVAMATLDRITDEFNSTSGRYHGLVFRSVKTILELKAASELAQQKPDVVDEIRALQGELLQSREKEALAGDVRTESLHDGLRGISAQVTLLSATIQKAVTDQNLLFDRLLSTSESGASLLREVTKMQVCANSHNLVSDQKTSFALSKLESLVQQFGEIKELLMAIRLDAVNSPSRRLLRKLKRCVKIVVWHLVKPFRLRNTRS
jgi:hypothetical protein